MKKRNLYFLFVHVVFVALLVTSIPSISGAGCDDNIIINSTYIGACGYTQSTSFKLDNFAYVTHIRIWYDTAIAGNTLSATLTGPRGYTNFSGEISIGDCQWSWCEANWYIKDILRPGEYTLTADSQAVCSNPSGETTLIVYGCEFELPK